MKDQKTIERIQLLHPKVRSEVESIYDEICEALSGRAMCRFAYTLRTFKEQQDLYEIGRSKPGKKVTNASAGLSYHNYGLAIDIVLIIDGKNASWDIKTDFDGDKKSDWLEIVTIFKQHGWTWGGDWKFVDYPHFEKTFGYSVRQLLEKHQAKKFIEKDYVQI